MNIYQKPNKELWKGRISKDQLYMHEKIKCIDLETDTIINSLNRVFALLGYACDEGVRRNQGRVGAAKGPNSIRKMIASLSNHFTNEVEIWDTGNMMCIENNLENTHQITTHYISSLINKGCFPIIMGGGHDLAYPHFNSIKSVFPDKTIGIINLDAHFDLRQVTDKVNSGTPFYQIMKETDDVKYLCLGIQEESNNKELFETANKFGVQYVMNTEFTMNNKQNIVANISNFITDVDYVYLTIDMDGFSSNFAPGVSAPSPLGFSIDIALEVIQTICESNKLISVDLVELNPEYDIDNCTARLASRIIYKIIDKLQKL